MALGPRGAGRRASSSGPTRSASRPSTRRSPADLAERLHDFAAGAFAAPPRDRVGAAPARARAWRTATTSPAIHDRYDALTHRFENEGGYDMVAEVDKALSGLGFDKADFGAASRGALRRAEEPGDARAGDPLVARRPAARRADEPPRLPGRRVPRGVPRAQSKRAYLVVTHDRRFLDRVAEEIVDLENGRLTAYSRRLHGLPAAEGRADPRGDAGLREAAGVHREGEGVHPPQHRRASTPARPRAGGRSSSASSGSRSPRRTPRTVAFRFDAARIGGRIFLRAKDLDAGYAAGDPIVRGVVLRAAAGRAAGDPRRERHRQDDAPEDPRGPAARARGTGHDRTRRLDRLLRPGALGPRPERAGRSTPSGTSTRRRPRRRCAPTWPASRSGATRSSRRIDGPLRRREGEADARRRHEAAPQPAAARRADEPPRPRLARGARGVARGLSGLDRLRVARPGVHRPARDARPRPARRAGRSRCRATTRETADARAERRNAARARARRLRGRRPAPAAAAARSPDATASARPSRGRRRAPAASREDREAARRRRRIQGARREDRRRSRRRSTSSRRVSGRRR